MSILDTNIVSELRKAKKADQNVRKWAHSLPAGSLYISVVSVLELEIGILLIERRDQQQGRIVRAWMDRHVLPTFSGRILAIDTECYTCLILAPIAMPSSQPQRSCMA
jgi:toxin FitB